MSDAPLTGLSAIELVRLIREREVSAVELMAATYDRLEAVNPELNAVVNHRDREEALRLAEAADGAMRADGPSGLLHGIPMAPKDSVDVEGFPTTFGFAPFASNLARADALIAARQRAAGALYIGKTNMPEFGLGSQTFNSLFGVTRNPYDLRKTPGGSSGGAAAAVAARVFAVADGSDMGGSLRNPASFCNVVGFRPSIGRVPRGGSGWFARLATSGPIARTVDDAALLLSVQAGPSSADPLSLPESGSTFESVPEIDPAGLRVGWSADLGLPVEGEVRRIVEQAAGVFASLGCDVAREQPDLIGAMDVFQAQRAVSLRGLGDTLDAVVPEWRAQAKDTAIWNVDKGRELDASAMLASEVRRTAIYGRVAEYFEHFDALVVPAAQVLPFDVETEWVGSIEGAEMETYIDWMTVCCVISVTGLPSISVPAGFSDDGLPVGIQIVGRPRGDRELLAIARLFERATGHHQRLPGILAQ